MSKSQDSVFFLAPFADLCNVSHVYPMSPHHLSVSGVPVEGVKLRRGRGRLARGRRGAAAQAWDWYNLWLSYAQLWFSTWQRRKQQGNIES